MLTALFFPAFNEAFPVEGQFVSIVVLIAFVVNVPAVKSALPSKTTPVFIAPKEPLLQIIVPLKTE